MSTRTNTGIVSTWLKPNPNYRADIDGLRAIAVLSVVGFHLFPQVITGGFIGVDVFFVISGFLITSIIYRKVSTDSFDFVEFYFRRIRRILPALLLVLLSCYAFGWFYLLPDEYAQMSRHIAGSTIFNVNVILSHETGYFDNAAVTKPLQHLWSLSIEEQFYLMWPLAIFAAHRYKVNLIKLGTAIFLFSFGYNIVSVYTAGAKCYYFSQARFWEILSGALLAFVYKARIETTSFSFKLSVFGYRNNHRRVPREISDATVRNFLSAVGLLFVLYGVFSITKQSRFPGFVALFPVVGSLFLILSGENAIINRTILTNKVAVFIGLISYPLYLWHWPMLSFTRIIEGEAPGIVPRMVIAILSVLLSIMTYLFIECKVRVNHRKTLIFVLVSISICFGGAGYIIHQHDGFITRFRLLAPGAEANIEKIATAWKFRGYPQPKAAFKDPATDLLRIGKSNKRVVLFVGDSHMEQYFNAFSGVRPDAITHDTTSVIFKSADFFPTTNDIDSKLLNDKAVDTVVFSYFWALRYGSASVNQAVRCCGEGKNGSVGRATIPLSTSEKMDTIDLCIEKTVNSLRSLGKNVVFILDNPFGEELDPHAMLERSWTGFKVVSPPILSKAAAIERDEPVRSRLQKIATSTNSTIIDPIRFFCDEETCPQFSDTGELLYKDYDHISLYSSTRSEDMLKPALCK